MTKRLSETQKSEILHGFESGKSIDLLSKEFKCTKVTVKRNLKKNLGELKFNELINKNKLLRSDRYIDKEKENNILDFEVEGITSQKDSQDSNPLNKNINKIDFGDTESFFEIVPLDYEIENATRKELSSVPISEVDFPKVAYMVVDKKIELEIKLLKDFPEWDFLPLDDLNRKTIEIFFDLNLAKRSCKKEQKVLKVNNTNVFGIAAPILVKRGISRIVCTEKLIAL